MLISEVDQSLMNRQCWFSIATVDGNGKASEAEESKTFLWPTLRFFISKVERPVLSDPGFVDP